jgi:hypothetical protein
VQADASCKQWKHVGSCKQWKFYPKPGKTQYFVKAGTAHNEIWPSSSAHATKSADDAILFMAELWKRMAFEKAMFSSSTLKTKMSPFEAPG